MPTSNLHVLSASFDPADLLRPGQVAAWLDVTARTVANWAAAGNIPFHRNDGAHLRFVAAEVAPAVEAMGHSVPPLPKSIAKVLRPPAESDPAAADDDQHSGRMRASQTPTASVEVGEFLKLQRFRGACDGTTAELFFDRGREPGRAVRNRHQAAKAICTLCPILAECSLLGRTDLTLEGIWDGETRKQRRQARRRTPHGQPTPAVPSGNPNGRLLVQHALRRAQHEGVHAAANRLGVPAGTLRRLSTLYGLDHQAHALVHPTLVAVGEARRG